LPEKAARKLDSGSRRIIRIILKRRGIMKKHAVVLGILLAMSLPTMGVAGSSFSPYVDEKGNISRPKDYREKWVYLGSYVVPDEKAPGYGFHDVFIQPASVEAYKRTGKFPDGTVLVKEIRKIKSGSMTTGQASWAGEMAVWFVMVKDQKGRFKNNPNWGDGWGWALFEPANPEKNTSKDYKKDCFGCHIPAKNTDWIYIEGLHTLR
jgi:hypothetical protein